MLERRVVLISCSVPSWLPSLAPSIRVVEQPDPWQSCRLLEPLPAHRTQKGLRARSQTHGHPPKVHSSQQRAHKNDKKGSNTIKHDQKKRGPSKTIENGQQVCHSCEFCDSGHCCVACKMSNTLMRPPPRSRFLPRCTQPPPHKVGNTTSQT